MRSAEIAKFRINIVERKGLLCITIQYEYKCGVAGTREKNEEIHLWLLDQERKKDRARSLKQKCNATEETKEFIHDKYFGNGEFDFMTEIENLEKEKVSLENETQSLETEQQQLMQKIKGYYQKTIEDLKIKNNAIREANNKLQERLDSLEESQESQESLSLGENARTSIEKLCGSEGDGEVDVSYWENSGTTIEDSSGNVLDKSQQSKKLKLFRG